MPHVLCFALWGWTFLFCCVCVREGSEEEAAACQRLGNVVVHGERGRCLHGVGCWAGFLFCLCAVLGGCGCMLARWLIFFFFCLTSYRGVARFDGVGRQPNFCFLAAKGVLVVDGCLEN